MTSLVMMRPMALRSSHPTHASRMARINLQCPLHSLPHQSIQFFSTKSSKRWTPKQYFSRIAQQQQPSSTNPTTPLKSTATIAAAAPAPIASARSKTNPLIRQRTQTTTSRLLNQDENDISDDSHASDAILKGGRSSVGQTSAAVKVTYSTSKSSNSTTVSASHSHLTHSRPRPSQPTNLDDFAGFDDDDDIPSSEFESHVGNLGRKPRGQLKKRTVDEDQERKRQDRRAYHRPPPTEPVRYTDRRDAPARPHWLPRHVPYKLVAPNAEAPAGWLRVLHKYGVKAETKPIHFVETKLKKIVSHPTSSSSMAGTRARRIVREKRMRGKEMNEQRQSAPSSSSSTGSSRPFSSTRSSSRGRPSYQSR